MYKLKNKDYNILVITYINSCVDFQLSIYSTPSSSVLILFNH